MMSLTRLAIGLIQQAQIPDSVLLLRKYRNIVKTDAAIEPEITCSAVALATIWSSPQ